MLPEFDVDHFEILCPNGTPGEFSWRSTDGVFLFKRCYNGCTMRRGDMLVYTYL